MSSWTDKIALETVKKLRDEFKIRYYIETGTFKGINAKVQSKVFDYIFTCEIVDEYINVATQKLDRDYNVYMYKASSPNFLSMIKEKHERLTPNEILFIYLDAHFYDPTLPADKRFVVIDELKSLKNTKNAIICIHDFWNDQFTGITYDNIKLDFNLLKHYLFEVNPNFKYYTNTKCDVYNKETIKELIDDVDADGNIEYANTSIAKRDRGILYCIPKELDLTKYDLKEIV
jgi:hypothetical protein